MSELSNSDSETSDCPPPVFVPEGGHGAAQPDEDHESIIPINDPEGAPSNIPFVELDDAPTAAIVLQLLIPTVLVKQILTIYALVVNVIKVLSTC